MKQLPADGLRVRLTHSLERYPHFTVQAGATGTVVEATEQLVRVKMDELISGAEEWDNEVCFTVEDDDGPQETPGEMFTSRAFWRSFQAVDVPMPSAEQIEQATAKASEAFWASVAASFPEVETGDFGPDESFDYDTACMLAVTRWLENNHPAA